jgi:hypothetical protein
MGQLQHQLKIINQIFPMDTSFLSNSSSHNPNYELMTIDAVQQALNRSRASIYRYANTEPKTLNLPYDPQKLNPEFRQDDQEALRFHPNEVARFARDVLQIKSVVVNAQESTDSLNTRLLQEILHELRTLNQQIYRLNSDKYNSGE